MSLRDELIQTVIGIGMMRRDVATDIVDAIMLKYDVSHSACTPHSFGPRYLTEVGYARTCMKCSKLKYVN